MRKVRGITSWYPENEAAQRYRKGNIKATASTVLTQINDSLKRKKKKNQASTFSELPLGRNLLLPLANSPLAAPVALPLNAPAV